MSRYPSESVARFDQQFREYSEERAARIARKGRTDVSELLALLKRAEEELRLIHMKDCAAVYDVGLRAEMRIAIAKNEA